MELYGYFFTNLNDQQKLIYSANFQLRNFFLQEGGDKRQIKTELNDNERTPKLNNTNAKKDKHAQYHIDSNDIYNREMWEKGMEDEIWSIYEQCKRERKREQYEKKSKITAQDEHNSTARQVK